MRRLASPLQGDVLLIDNHKAMHSRETFVAPRRVLASLWASPEEAGEETAGLNQMEFGGLGSAYSTLYKLCPGGFSTISALIVSDNNKNAPPQYTTDPEVIATQLHLEWGQIFEPSDTSCPDPSHFLEDVRGFSSCSTAAHKLRDKSFVMV